MSGRQRWVVSLIAALCSTGCKADLCKQQKPELEVEVVLPASIVVPAGTAQLQAEVVVGANKQDQLLDEGPLLTNRQGRFVVMVGDDGRAGFVAHVVLRLLSKITGVLLAQADQTFQGSGDACNFFSMVLGAPSDGGIAH